MFKLLSDIHLEESGTFENLPPIAIDAPYLFLVGDIGYPTLDFYKQFLLQQSERFKGVFILAGNHEFHNTSYQKAKRDINEICKLKNNLYFMDKRSMLVDGMRILGTTLWSFVPDEHADFVSKNMIDYNNLIKIEEETSGVHMLTVADTNFFHKQELDWLKQEIKKASVNGEPIIVLTHHAPTFHLSANPKYDGDRINYAFQTDLDYMMNKPIVCWCFGHTHYSSDQIINGVRLVSNQLGYLMVNEKETGFRSDLIIELEIIT